MAEQIGRSDRILYYILNLCGLLWLSPREFIRSIKFVKLLGQLLYCLRTSPIIRLAVLIICVICMWEIVVRDKTLPTYTLMSPKPYNASSACHMVRIHPSRTSEQRCYPLLINFAHGCCKRSQKNNCLTGLKHGIRQCLMFNKKIFNNDPIFANHNENILDRKKGAGYWLWKPYILLRELNVARDGDIIVYSDAAADFVANVSHLTKLTANQDIVVFELLGWKESTWTKRDTFIILDVDRPEYINTPAGLASYIIVKKSFTSMRFVSEWLTYAQDSRAITDDENVLGSRNYPGFRGHRHDQSILSLLVKKWKLTVYPDPSQWGQGAQRSYPTIFDHHRSKN